jgi:hypothetical protein
VPRLAIVVKKRRRVSPFLKSIARNGITSKVIATHPQFPEDAPWTSNFSTPDWQER